jgi:hypothetical protein
MGSLSCQAATPAFVASPRHPFPSPSSPHLPCFPTPPLPVFELTTHHSEVNVTGSVFSNSAAGSDGGALASVLSTSVAVSQLRVTDSVFLLSEAETGDGGVMFWQV